MHATRFDRFYDTFFCLRNKFSSYNIKNSEYLHGTISQVEL